MRIVSFTTPPDLNILESLVNKFCVPVASNFSMATLYCFNTDFTASASLLCENDVNPHKIMAMIIKKNFILLILIDSSFCTCFEYCFAKKLLIQFL